jgi:hypothetical protein
MYDSLSLLSSNGILRKPVVYSEDNIFLFNDQHFYDLLFELSVFHYSWVKSILLKIWNIRRPEPEEKQWLQEIEGELAVTKAANKARENRERIRLTYLKKVELVRNLKLQTEKRTNEIEEQLEKDYHDIYSDQKYEFIIEELRKFIFPNWFRKIKTYKSSSRPKKSFVQHDCQYAE